MSKRKLPKTLFEKDDSITNKDWLDLSWNYFSLLSGQRMGMVDFYIVIEAALIGALFVLLTLEERMMWAECTVAVAITFISVTFFILDCRTKAMIHCCENIIMAFEKLYYPEGKEDKKKDENKEKIVLPFHYIDYKTDKMRVRMTYSKIFLVQYSVIGLFGVVCLILVLRGTI